MTTSQTTSTTKQKSSSEPPSPLGYFKLKHEAHAPTKAYNDDIGWDLYAYGLNDRGVSRNIIIGQKQAWRVPTGLVLIPPEGFYIQILSRSGLAAKCLFVANAPGLVDPGYRGQLEVILFNGGPQSYFVAHGDRIAQAVLVPIPEAGQTAKELTALPPGSRGDAGFGSTGR